MKDPQGGTLNNNNPVLTGRQLVITGNGIIPPGSGGSDADFVGVTLDATHGNSAGPVYRFRLPVRGASKVRVTLRVGSQTGTVATARIYKTLEDHTTEKMSLGGVTEAVAFPTLTTGLMVGAEISDLCGEETVMLEITVGTTANFNVGELCTL